LQAVILSEAKDLHIGDNSWSRDPSLRSGWPLSGRGDILRDCLGFGGRAPADRL